MKAAALWKELGEAGVKLTTDGDALGYLAPAHAMTAALVARLRAEKVPLLAVVSGAYRAEIEGWGAAHRERYQERAAIVEFEGGLTQKEAERLAYLEHLEAIAAEAEQLTRGAPLTADEGEELFAWPAWAQGTWQNEADHLVHLGASRPAAERRAFEAVRSLLRPTEPVRCEEEPPRCTNPRCKGAPNLLGLRACSNCSRARQGVGPKPAALPSRTGAVREVREPDGLRWTRRLGAGASLEGFVPLEPLALAPDPCPSCRARVQPGPGGCPHGGRLLPEGFGAEREDGQEAAELAPVRRHDPRPVVSSLTCGGCGCKALADGGRGACERCGWRRRE